MLDTIKNMLATHSTIQQRENKNIDTGKQQQDKFSDHVSAAEDQSQKDRKKPEETSPKKEDEPVEQKQETEKPAQKEKPENNTETQSKETANVDSDDNEVDFDTALLLLNEIQEAVEGKVEFIQANTDQDAGQQQDDGQTDGALLGAVNELLGAEQGEGDNSDLPADIKSALLSGQQQGQTDGDENNADDQVKVATNTINQNVTDEAAKGKQAEATVAPLERIVKDTGLKKPENAGSLNTGASGEGEGADGLGEELQNVKGGENLEGRKEKKAAPRIITAQGQANFNNASQLANNGSQIDPALTALQNNQQFASSSQVGLNQGLQAGQQATQVPINNLAVHIAGQAQNGNKRFDIMLDPPELGRIEVRLDVAKDGATSTHIFVERSETLDLLQRDARALEKALHEAGLDMKEGNLQFSLKEEGFKGDGNDDDDVSDGSQDEITDIENLDVNIDHVLNLYRQSGMPGGLDIRV